MRPSPNCDFLVLAHIAGTVHTLRALLSLTLAAMLGLSAAPLRAQATEDFSFFTLAGGDIGGNYFAVARAICREINRRHVGMMRCSPESTPGSVYNLTGLRLNQIEFAIVQSDTMLAARGGTGGFARMGPFEDLRGVATLYDEAIVVLVQAGSGIEDLADLAGKRVDVGPISSGRRASLERILAALDLDVFDFSEASELASSAAVDEFCGDRLDAVVLIVGNPDRNVARALSECGGAILPLGSSRSATAIGELGVYENLVLPAGIYPELTTDLATFGVKAMLVTREAASAEEVQAIADALGRNTAMLVRAAPVLAQDATHGWPERSAVPVHPALAPQ